MQLHEVMGEYEDEGRVCEELGFCMVIHPIIVTPNHSDPFIVTFIQSNIVTSIRANQYKQKLSCDVRVFLLDTTRSSIVGWYRCS